jgi:hypothetical protein
MSASDTSPMEEVTVDSDSFDDFSGGYDGPQADLAADDLDRDDPERELSSTLALFEGDEGGLELAQRRALVALLKHRFISARTHQREWNALVANPRLIRTRLNDLFLDLHLDPDREVAYKRQVAPEGGGRPFPTLLHDTPWGREDTVLLVYLRSHCHSERAKGAERVFVDKIDMLEHIAQNRPGSATDQSGDAKRATKAVETLYRAGLLIGPTDADRFEVSRAIEVLLPMPKLHELLAWLRTQTKPDGELSDYCPQTTDTTDDLSEPTADESEI